MPGSYLVLGACPLAWTFGPGLPSFPLVELCAPPILAPRTENEVGEPPVVLHGLSSYLHVDAT